MQARNIILKMQAADSTDVDIRKKKFSHYLVDEAQQSLMLSVGYLPCEEQTDIIDACHFGDIAHIKDKRKSGEPYITHPIAVAEILAGFKLDRDTIIAAILHDTVEDTDVSLQDLTEKYGVQVAKLVDGVTKLKSSSQNKQQNKAATFHKILTATLNDPRVLVVKLADRLHNMSTLGAVRREKQKSTAQETLDFYIPFARVMGMNDLADHIEMLCYRNLDPEMYTKLSDKLLQHGLGRKFRKDEIHDYLQRLLRVKKLHGHVKMLDYKVDMYRQFFRNRGTIDELIRQYAFEIVLEDVKSCKNISNYLINKYNIPDTQISDNIRNPLPGGNQSLTLTYVYQHNTIKVTLLTHKMQKAARLGIIGADNASAVSQSVIQASLRNMKSLVSDDMSVSNPNIDEAVETIEQLMDYLHERKILCYSPKGKAYELPRHSTVLDFAYAVGPKIGHIAVSGSIDGKPCDLATVVYSGQTVEIITDKNSLPKAEWLGFVITSKARELIQKWFKALPDEQKVTQGKLALDRALKTYGKDLHDLTASDWQDVLNWRKFDNKDDLFWAISAGKLLPQLVISRLFSEEVEAANAVKNASNCTGQSQNLIANLGNGVEISFPKCCNPVYGDPVLAYNSRHHGLVIHRHKCYELEEVRKRSPNQIFKILWQTEEKLAENTQGERPHFHSFLKICAQINEDQLSEAILNLRQINVGVEKVEYHEADTLLFVVVRSRQHLAHAIRELRNSLGFPNIMRLYQVPNN